jgi:predicted HicB family RNase H-like nuclease
MTVLEMEPPVVAEDNDQAPRGRFDLRAEPEWLARVEAQAKRHGLSMSAYIRQATTIQLEQDEQTDPRAKKKK